MIKDVYDAKEQNPVKPSSRPGKQMHSDRGKLEMIRNVIDKVSNPSKGTGRKATVKHSITTTNPGIIDELGLVEEEKRSRTISPLPFSCQQSPLISFAKTTNDAPPGFRLDAGKNRLKNTTTIQHYVNDFETKCNFVDPNPVVIIQSLLRDLLAILKACKGKGPSMFHIASKQKCFKKIEKQAAALRVRLINLVDIIRKANFSIRIHTLVLLSQLG